MSCECGDDYPSVHSSGIRRARVEHKCSACSETIRRGDRYHYTFIVFDGEPDETKRCARCEVMYRALVAKHRGIEDFTCDPELKCGHTWEENFDDPLPPEMARLAFVTADEAQALLGPEHNP